MKKSVFALAATVFLAACGQQSYQSPVAQGCDPNVTNCYGTGVGRDSHGDAILAGAAGLAAGAYLGHRMSNNNSGYHDNGYQRPRTIVVNHYHMAPTTSFSRPSAPSRTMFASARRR